MAKAKKTEKRSAPKKAAKRKPHSSESYLKLADAIMHGIPAPTKPEPRPKRKVKRKATVVKMTKPELAVESKQAKAPVVRGLKFEARYPERVPEKPPEIERWPYPRKAEPLAKKLIDAVRHPERAPEPEAPKIDISVRNVYYDGQYLPALCFRKPGALHVPCVCGDPVNGIRKFTIAAPQHDKSTVLQHGYGNFAAPYTPERFASHMRRIAGAAPVTPEARAMLLPYCPDMPLGPAPAELPAPIDEAQPVRARTQPGNGSRAPSGPARTSGKELIRTLADASGLPPEKIRAKLRAAGLRAPYTDEVACRKALDINGPTPIPEPRRKKA